MKNERPRLPSPITLTLTVGEIERMSFIRTGDREVTVTWRRRRRWYWPWSGYETCSRRLSHTPGHSDMYFVDTGEPLILAPEQFWRALLAAFDREIVSPG